MTRSAADPIAAALGVWGSISLGTMKSLRHR
jgi:hypothetical protein